MVLPDGRKHSRRLLGRKDADELVLEPLETVDPDEKQRINRSRVHIDFMIRSPALAVDRITRDGSVVPVLRDGAWRI